MPTNEHTNQQLSNVTTAVRELAGIMHASGLSKLDVITGDVSIRLKAGGTPKVPAISSVAELSQSLGQVELVLIDQAFLITAPMIGTYYTSPAPGEPQFVHIGERIDVGQIIGIIEAMKIMNEIPAERAGVVVELLAANSQAVEYGSPLLRIAPDQDDE